jgi:hypothetical protein
MNMEQLRNNDEQGKPEEIRKKIWFGGNQDEPEAARWEVSV